MKQFKFIDLFAGIGGIRLGFEGCNSSVKFQDDLFNAIWPEILTVLGDYNAKFDGVVEAYIYGKFLDNTRS